MFYSCFSIFQIYLLRFERNERYKQITLSFLLETEKKARNSNNNINNKCYIVSLSIFLPNRFVLRTLSYCKCELFINKQYQYKKRILYHSYLKKKKEYNNNNHEILTIRLIPNVLQLLFDISTYLLRFKRFIELQMRISQH